MKIAKKFPVWIIPLDYVKFTSGEIPYQAIKNVALFDAIVYTFKQGWFTLPKGISLDTKKTIQKKVPFCLAVDSNDCTIVLKDKNVYCRFENVVVTIEV